jgi:hypothetical protein
LILRSVKSKNRRDLTAWKFFSGKKTASDVIRIFKLTNGSRFFFSFALLSFVAIVAFSTLFHVHVICTTKNGKLRNDVLVEEIVKSFSMICEFKKLFKTLSRTFEAS